MTRKHMNAREAGRMAVKNTLGAVLLYAFIYAALAQQQLPSAVPDAPDPNTEATETDAEFRGLDRNRDGVLTIEEVGGSPSLVEGFRTADRNGDGRIDRSEYGSLRGFSMINRSLILSPPPAANSGSGPSIGGSQDSGLR